MALLPLTSTIFLRSRRTPLVFSVTLTPLLRPAPVHLSFIFIVLTLGAGGVTYAHPAQVVACNALPDALITISDHNRCLITMSVPLMEAMVAVDMVYNPTILQRCRPE